MKKKFYVTLWCALAAAAFGAKNGPDTVRVPDLQAYRTAWQAVRPELDESIRTNRMGGLSVSIVDADGRPVPGATVEVKLVQHEFLFGCNALVLGQMGEKEAAWEAAFLKLFNLATTTFCLGVVEPSRGVFRFEDAGPGADVWRRPPPDRVLEFCRRNGIKAKGQPLMAGSWHPKWAANCSLDESKAIYSDYFRRVAERYGTSYAMFDVVNEAYKHRTAPFYDDKYEFEAWALMTAADLFPPSCRLCINELSVVNSASGVAEGYRARVRKLKERGIRLDGVGLQFHAFTERDMAKILALKKWTPAGLKKCYDEMWALGVPLYITEITIPSTLGGTTVGEGLQAEVAENFYRLWFAHPGFSGITWWNLSDGAAWKNEGRVLGGLIDDDMREKPAYQRLYQLIRREWCTRARLTANADGKVDFRGFYGRYAARISVAGAVENLEFDLLRGGPGKLTLKLSGSPGDAQKESQP